MSKKTLHLTLKKEWFEMIASGEKKEEYRELKEYWRNRLWEFPKVPSNNARHFDTIIFRNGYGKNAPEMEVECEGISIGYGKGKWGAEPNVKYYIISLGSVLYTKNYRK